jgi:hypothetical protein
MQQARSPASARRGFLVGIGLSLLAIPLLIGLDVVAPAFMHWLESLDDYQLKPWIYLAPLGLILAAVPILRPNYRNARALAGLVAGTLFLAIVAVGLLVFLASAGLPNMRY